MVHSLLTRAHNKPRLKHVHIETLSRYRGEGLITPHVSTSIIGSTQNGSAQSNITWVLKNSVGGPNIEDGFDHWLHNMRIYRSDADHCWAWLGSSFGVQIVQVGLPYFVDF